jgi:hypothetical protein
VATGPLQNINTHRRIPMKKLTLLFLFFILASCNQPSNVGADNYKFGEKQYENSSVSVDIVTYQSRNDLLKEARKYGVTNSEIVAFALLLRNDQTKCTVHMMDPAVSYEPEFVGHEFLHCVYGQWHTDNNSIR